MNPRFVPQLIVALAAVSLLGMGGCVNREAQKQAKETAQVINDPTVEVVAQPPATKDLTESVTVTGDVTTSDDTSVGPKASGKLVSVSVQDGDRVSSGQVVAQMDTSVLSEQVAQASAQAAQARATLGQAQSALSQALRNQAINPSKTTSAIASAQANLRSAQANLQKVRTGARPQERLQAQAQVASAKANLETQQKQLDRIRTLVQQGALAGSQLDTQQATYEAARTTYQNAVQSLNLIQEGNRVEDVRAAQEQVRAAQEEVTTARANKSLDTLYGDQVANAQAQIQAAQAQIQAAQSGVAQARQNLADATIRAPFAGTVSGRPAQPGAVLSPGGTIVRIVGGQGVYFEGSIPSDTINDVKPGQRVSVTVDALGNRTFPATVRTVGNLGSAQGRLFTARIVFDGAPSDVKPGMFARGVIVLRTIPGATVVPTVAIQKSDEGGAYVMVVQNGTAKRVPVEVGLAQGDVSQISGLPAGAPVIVKGQTGLQEGAKVKQVKS